MRVEQGTDGETVAVPPTAPSSSACRLWEGVLAAAAVPLRARRRSGWAEAGIVSAHYLYCPGGGLPGSAFADCG